MWFSALLLAEKSGRRDTISQNFSAAGLLGTAIGRWWPPVLSYDGRSPGLRTPETRPQRAGGKEESRLPSAPPVAVADQRLGGDDWIERLNEETPGPGWAWVISGIPFIGWIGDAVILLHIWRRRRRRKREDRQ